MLAGAFIFAFCTGLAILRGAALPTWMGWVAIVIGIAALIPPASFPALLALLLWTLIASILMYRRSGAPAAASTTSAPQPA